MSFSQFLYSTIQVGIGVVIGWLLSLIAQLKMQKRQHDFELGKLKIERTEPYKERLHNLKFETYSHIWSKFMECWKEFVYKQWKFESENTVDLSNAVKDFNLEFNKKSIILNESVVIIILKLLVNLDSIVFNHSVLCDETNEKHIKEMREDSGECRKLIDNLEKEIRKDLQLPQIEKSLVETFYPKEPSE